LASSCGFGEFFRRAYLIAASSQEVEASLIEVIFDVVGCYFDVFLVEDALVASYEAKYLDVFAQQAVDDVVAS
jgi:hypothetical protein